MTLELSKILTFCLICLSAVAVEVSVPKKWTCNQNEHCVPYVGQKTLESPSIYETQDICRLSCGRYGPLWPRPTGAVNIGQGRVNFNPNNIRVDIYATTEDVVGFLEGAKALFINNVLSECKKDCNFPGNHTLVVQIRVANGELDLSWTTDESSVLVVTTTGDTTFADVQAGTVYGARHALETLTQFITAAADNTICPPVVISIPSVKPVNNSLSITYNVDISIRNKRRGTFRTLRRRPCFRSGLVMVSSARIVDKPTYSHRGIMLDTARNFMSVDIIKRTLDAMAASKLNVFHWHATDSQSFPLDIPQVPQLQRFGAYSAELTYSRKEMDDIIRYAQQRGIRTVIEIDSPAHASNGWQWGPLGGLGDLAVCVNQQPWRHFCIEPPCGQLNPVNENLYSILRLIYEDINSLLPRTETLHLGGDEVKLECWNSSTEIVNKLRERGLEPNVEGFHQLWSEFHLRTQRILSDIKGKDTKTILWSSGLTDPNYIEHYLPADKFIIQTWVPESSPLVQQLLMRGYQLIVTPKDAWYLDHGFWGVNPYYNWRTVYEKLVPRDPNVLGGEVCMWSEFTDGNSVESRIWPRAGAAAERLWSDPSTNSIMAESRFNRYRDRLIARGVSPDAITPKWCTLNEGECK